MSSLATNAITDASGGNTATINSFTPTVSNMAGRNRIINGDMRIDQRNAGASVTNVVGPLYSIDRFWTFGTQASKFTAQRNAGGVTPPVGFTNYLGITSSGAYSVSSSDFFQLYQSIEGFNTADFGWGTASAQTVTLSFWVRSSLTGTFGGSLLNGASNRVYPYSYNISAANTWEQKTVTIPGDTSGTWLTDNGAGIYLGFNLGSGSAHSGTAGLWSSTAYRAPTGATSVVGTSGATFYITGVQLEAGSVATPFEHRQYGQELVLCQRYYEKSYEIGTAPGAATQNGIIWSSQMQAFTTTFIGMSYTWKVQKRATPTIVAYDKAGTSGVLTRWALGTSEFDGSNYTLGGYSDSIWQFYSSGSSNSAGVKLHFTASAEL